MSSNRIKGQEIQMGDNYVLPIEQSRVTRSQAKVQQILEETDMKAQQMLEQAENKTQIIVQTANNEATRIIEDARKKGESEYDAVKQQAYEEGFKKGEEDGLKKFQEDAIDGLNGLGISAYYDSDKGLVLQGGENAASPKRRALDELARDVNCKSGESIF